MYALKSTTPDFASLKSEASAGWRLGGGVGYMWREF